jgi:hypothetical protein
MMTGRKQERICCEKCGSTMFAESHFRQYLKAPSSLPGGDPELSAIEQDQDIRALICLCGHPVRLGPMRRQIRGDQISFAKSCEMAIQHGKGEEPQAKAEILPAIFASKSRQMEQAEQISQLEEVIRAVRRPARDPKKPMKREDPSLGTVPES